MASLNIHSAVLLKNVHAGLVIALMLTFMGVLAGCSERNDPQPAVASVKPQSKAYVLTEFRLVLPGAGPEDCPNGFNKSAPELLVEGLSSEERVKFEENPKAYIQKALPAYYENPDIDPCANPAKFKDTGHFTIDRPLNLLRMGPEGEMLSNPMPSGTCPSFDTFSANVNKGTIDNQYWRVMGCVQGYQPGGLAESLFGEIQIREGNMTILIEVTPRVDGDSGAVELGIYSSLEPVPLGGDGNPLSMASLSINSPSRFHNRVRGKQSGSVITSEPFDLRLIQSAARLDSELFLRNARVRLEIDENDRVSGFIAGYWDIEWLAHAMIRIQDRTGLSSGFAAAMAHKYTCPGVYQAMWRMADGHPDRDTGKCTSISVLYELDAVPAFVIQPD